MSGHTASPASWRRSRVSTPRRRSPGQVARFVALHEATIELPEQSGATAAERPYVHVNRYAVERVDSTLMLGFFFPGARFVGKEPEPESERRPSRPADRAGG